MGTKPRRNPLRLDHPLAPSSLVNRASQQPTGAFRLLRNVSRPTGLAAREIVKDRRRSSELECSRSLPNSNCNVTGHVGCRSPRLIRQRRCHCRGCGCGRGRGQPDPAPPSILLPFNVADGPDRSLVKYHSWPELVMTSSRIGANRYSAQYCPGDRGRRPHAPSPAERPEELGLTVFRLVGRTWDE